MYTCITIDVLYGTGRGCQLIEADIGPLRSHLVNSLISQVATDSDNDWLGIAVVNVNNGQGVWQYNREQLQGIYNNTILI